MLRTAEDLIGTGAKDDYIIAPTQHAVRYAETATALSDRLSSSDVKTTAEQYERLDQAALEAQQHFKRLSDRANLAVLLTAVLVALTLATGAAAPSLPTGLVSVLLMGLSLGSVVAGALASRYLLLIRQGQLLEEWMAKRALAETARLEYFERITSAAPSAVASEVPVALLQLEYFRRYQFDVQCNYYGTRSKEHRRSAAKTLALSGWAVAGGALATGVAGVLGVSLNSAYVALGALGAIFTALAAFATTREAVNQDRRNAERYARTHQVLEDLGKRLDQVRHAVHKAGAEPLGDFVAAVHEQLSLEHRQWLGELGEARGAFAQLEETLKTLSADLPAKT